MNQIHAVARPRTVGQLAFILEPFKEGMKISPIEVTYMDPTATEPAHFRIEAPLTKMCETCSHYQPDEMVPGSGRCMRVDHATTRELRCYHGALPDEAVLVDNGDDFAVLRCKPSFGCVLHKAKP